MNEIVTAIEKALIKEHTISSDRNEAIYQIAQLMILEKTLCDLIYHELDPADVVYNVKSIELEVEGEKIVLGTADSEFPLIGFFALRFFTEGSKFNVTESDLRPIYEDPDRFLGIEIETQSLAFHPKDRHSRFQNFRIEDLRKITYELD